MTHVAHSAAANAAVVATHSTAAKVKPASATTAASATHATTASAAALHELEHAGGRFEVKSGLAFAGSCIAANRATPLARAVIVIAYRI
jgi:hypothetical protein